MAKMKAKSFGDLYKKAPEFNKIKKAASEGEVLERFYEIFIGYEAIAIPVKITKGILYIEIENAAWRNELKFRDEEIAERINGFFGETRVRKVVLTN